MSRDGRPLPEPSWPTVIATTLRLWMQRHIFPARAPSPSQPGNPSQWTSPPQPRRHRRVAVATLARPCALDSQHGRGSATTVQIEFTAPSPIGLLNAGVQA